MSLNTERLLLLEEKKIKGQLTPQEAGELKSLQRLAKKQQAKDEKISEPKTNVFGKVATTTINPIPVRLLSTELTALETKQDDLIAKHSSLIISELGSLREVNRTKLIRAAIELLIKTGDEEVIKAIKQVQMKMIKYDV